MARKNFLERQEPRKRLRDSPGSEGWPVLFWLCRMEIITVHSQAVQTFIDDKHGQIIIITAGVEGATGEQVNVSLLLRMDSFFCILFGQKVSDF